MQGGDFQSVSELFLKKNYRNMAQDINQKKRFRQKAIYLIKTNNETKNGALGGGRTHNLHLRRVALYPIELRVHAI